MSIVNCSSLWIVFAVAPLLICLVIGRVFASIYYGARPDVLTPRSKSYSRLFVITPLAALIPFAAATGVLLLQSYIFVLPDGSNVWERRISVLYLDDSPGLWIECESSGTPEEVASFYKKRGWKMVSGYHNKPTQWRDGKSKIFLRKGKRTIEVTTGSGTSFTVHYWPW